MMLLQRLAIRDARALRDVVVDFRPKGRHAIVGTLDELAAVRRAVQIALFGVEPANATAAQDLVGGSVELEFVAGGTPYTIYRPLDAESRDGPWLVRHSARGHEELRELHRIRRALSGALVLDPETFAAVTDVLASLGTLANATPRDLIRRLLGGGRVDALTAAFGVSAELEAGEADAAARVQLAEAAAALVGRIETVATFEAALGHARILRATQAFEASQRTAAGAQHAAATLETLVAAFAVSASEARAARRLYELWRERWHHQADWARASDRRRRAEEALGGARALDAQAGHASTRLNFAERALEMYAEAVAATRAADAAREEKRALEARLRDAGVALAELEAARSRVAGARAEATRAETLHRRAREDAYLPAAHRHWTQWVEHAGDAPALERDRATQARLDEERDAAERVALNMLRQAGEQRSRLTVAGAGAGLGAAVAVIGAIAASPVLPLGLIGGLGAGAWAGWLAWSGRESATLRGELDAILDQIEKDRHAVEARLKAHAALARQRLELEQQLRAMEFEVPATLERAQLLRDSATARLQLMSDSDRRVSESDRAQALAEARRRLERAEAEVRMLASRAGALEGADAEVRLAGIEARLRGSLETAAHAQQRAAASARAAGLADAAAEVTRALDGLRAEHAALQARLDELPGLELSHEAALGAAAAAAEALRRVEAAIASHLREHQFLPAAEPAAAEQPQRDARVALIEVLARHGEGRARTVRRDADLRLRQVHAAARRAQSDVAAALRGAGLDAGAAPTAAEVHALVPNLDATAAPDPASARTELQAAQAAVHQLEVQVRALEARTGMTRGVANLTAARQALDALLRRRRIRQAAATIVERAMDAMAEAVLPATEAYARQMLGLVTGGAYWDLRVGPGLRVDVWDEYRETWTAPDALPAELGRLIDTAVAIGFLAAATPRDITHPPAFLWLTQGTASSDSIAALLDALAMSGLSERFPQLIVACEPDRFVPAGFDSVATILRGHTAPRPDPAHAVRSRLRAVG